MVTRRPIPKRRQKPRVVHSERTEHITGHKRIRLKMFSKAWYERRAEIFERAKGRCEEMIGWGDGKRIAVYLRCPNRATEWSHARHGANKCDCLNPACSIASCAACHRRRHNPKACPPKPRDISGGMQGLAVGDRSQMPAGS